MAPELLLVPPELLEFPKSLSSGGPVSELVGGSGSLSLGGSGKFGVGDKVESPGFEVLLETSTMRGKYS